MATPLPTLDANRQALIGLGLAALVIGAWTWNHVHLVWIVDPLAAPLETALRAALQVWLSVGLFIVAHDAMHGSLAPFRPRVNEGVGGLVLALYAGFSFRALIVKHHAHHRHAGTADDPDFDHENPDRPVRWYLAFMGEYLSWRLFGWVTLLATFYSLAVFALHPDGTWRWLHVFGFWLFPSLLASMQLFWFGTFLPHRHEAGARPDGAGGRPDEAGARPDEAGARPDGAGARPDAGFADRHNSRSNDYPAWLSLLTCFHFGYHHEHHLAPSVPWWRLPAMRRACAVPDGVPA